MEPPRPACTRTDWEKDFKLRECEHTAAEWESQRPEFQKLYLQENLKLPVIRKIMAQKHRFYATKRQFDRKIKEWGLNKNLKRKDAIIMFKKQHERLAAEGKLTEFTLNGLPVTTEKLQRHVSGYQPGDSPAAATPDCVEYWTPRNPDLGTPSESYGTPRVYSDSTPIAMEQNPETPRPYLTYYQPVNSLDHDMQSPVGTYTNPLYINSDDTEMFDAESISPGPELVFPANPIIESQHEENHTFISSPPRSQYIGNTIMSTTTMGAEKVPCIVDRSSESRNSLNTSLGLEKTGIERSPRTTHNSAREDNIQRLAQLLHRKSFSELEILPLIQSGVGLYTQCRCCSKSLLYLAAESGHEAVARLLLDKGADIYTPEKEVSWTPLHIAAYNGHEAMARLLLEKGADASALTKEDSWTPLHLAARYGHEAVARLLLEKGADISALMEKLKTPLHIAAQGGHEAVARLLLEKGADASALEVYSWTPLHLAAQDGHEAVARLLLEKGADVFALTEEDSGTPLHLAAIDGHEAMARLLLEKGADASALTKEDSWTPLHLSARYGHEAVARLLLEKGADVFALTKEDSWTPLHLAARYDHEAVARLLLEKGADISAPEKELSWPPLDFVVQKDHEAVARLLVESGADYFRRHIMAPLI